jgi:gamma-glutamylcyclotransferase (GGCT)/AIG2-like uncharacterized protein YtfP
MLELLVYGSLKRDQPNFARYCAGYSQVSSASVAGQLYRQTNGYPMIVVPAGHIQAIGTSDGAADVKLLERLQTEHPCEEAELPAGDWEWIEGDLFGYTGRFVERLRRLDLLEDFNPGQRSVYYRAAVPARTDQGTRWVWTYVAAEGEIPAGAVRIGTTWP